MNTERFTRVEEMTRKEKARLQSIFTGATAFLLLTMINQGVTSCQEKSIAPTSVCQDVQLPNTTEQC